MRRLTRAAAATCLLGAAALLAASPARAILPTAAERADGRRFSFDRFHHHGGHLSIDASSSTIVSYNRRRPRGLGLAAAGHPPAVAAREAAEAFLRARGPALGIDPASLVFERASDGGSHRHALFRQTYRGLPVDFARVKVHMKPDGSVTGVDSDFDAHISLSVSPGITGERAAGIAQVDAQGGQWEKPRLVIFLDPARIKPPRLAWRVRLRRKDALWRYYIDADSGLIVFRYNDLREVGTCGFPVSGTVEGYVYDVDPSSTPIKLRPFSNERVFVGDGTQWALTDHSGVYCSSALGKVFTQLQGPNVNVASFIGPSAHYDNGSGVWQTIGTPASSPHPYPDNAVLTSTIDISGGIAPGAVEFLPVFSRLTVGAVSGGSFGESSDITDDDEVQLVDQFGHVAGSYVGSFAAPFHAAAVPGTLLRVQLKSNSAGNNVGYDVSVSSYLTLTQQYVTGSNNDVVWTTSQTATGLRSELSLFYHLNLMHDYFQSLMTSNGSYVAPSSAAYLPSSGVNAMAWAGPDLVNAFYDPDYDDLFFGDVASQDPQDTFTDDATVPHHEYTHYVVQKIWPIQNFGQAGAISEAIADYFSASSFEYDPNVGIPDSSIGLYTVEAFGGTGALRELDCPTKAPCAVLSNTTWHGEIHDDSVFVSQALWDIRKDRESLQGAPLGGQCVDRLVFNALLYFPESFSELENALLKVDADGVVAQYCGGAGSLQSDILGYFANHGIAMPGGTNDPYDVTVGITQVLHNDGFETAVDVSSTPDLAATIYPSGDVDFYTFGAGPGLVQVKMDLPSDQNNFYKGYMITLYNESHEQVAQAAPTYDGINTDSGLCADQDCTTTNSSVELDYNNPTGQQLFAEISGGVTFDGGSTSGVYSTTQYKLHFAYPKAGALSSSIVTAKVDNDDISYSVHVTSFSQQQDYFFSYAQLRDHDESVIPNSQTSSLLSPSGYLTLVSSNNALGTIWGDVRLQNGFSTRFPSLGRVHVEVFGYNVAGSTVSLGVSNAIDLTTNDSDVRAYNNVFSPARGEHATFKWDVLSAGHLRMRLYTMSGTFIENVLDEDVPAGKGAVDWEGRNSIGSDVASGIYLLRVEGPGLNKTVKVAVVK